ncbi:hypothetical protein ACS60K_07710 [Streptococcus suis]
MEINIKSKTITNLIYSLDSSIFETGIDNFEETVIVQSKIEYIENTQNSNTFLSKVSLEIETKIEEIKFRTISIKIDYLLSVDNSDDLLIDETFFDKVNPIFSELFKDRELGDLLQKITTVDNFFPIEIS